MMNPVPWLQMTNMISYQGLVRTFPRRIGSVINVSATELIVNLSSAGSGEASWSFGNRIAAGEVNEFVFIDVGETAILGRLVKVWIEGGERVCVDGLA
ncbi:hypothetical protein, partial [Escherichia coli]|uniref:hypothetical protein n=1 Tax=Escherichia coli TaxID=562 RepID=UPI003A522F0C|nr:hypothetical protein [Escherichia coli]